MTWSLQVTGPAQRDLRRLPPRDHARVKATLVAMQEDPFSGDIARLKAQPAAWRRRVGSYRIFYDVYPRQLLIVVTAVQPRASTTY